MTEKPPSSPAILIERQQSVLLLTIDATANRNSLSSPGVLEGLLEGLNVFEQDAELRCAIITGAGGCFSSGGDLHQLRSSTENDVRARMNANAWLYRRIALCEKLIIAAVDGPAFGAGMGLAACCDVVVAGRSARFCCAFVRVGAMPDAGLFWSLPARVGASKAKLLMLFAEEVGGAEALAIGLADHFSATDSALPTAQAMAQKLAHGPGRAYGRIKAGLRQSPMSLEQALAFQLDNAPGLFTSADFKEGAAAFFEKRKPEFHNR